MHKHFISADTLLLDAFKLARQIYESDFRPEFIIGVWRGGAPVGIAVQEYLDFVGVETDHIAIRTSSYYGIDQQHKTVNVHGIDYVIKNVRPDHKVLIVDDVFDSGRSLHTILEVIREKAGENTPNVIKIACPWFKPKRNITQLVPDFYLYETDDWLVFPHELKGLTKEEVIAGKGAAIAAVLNDPKNAK